MRQIKIFLFTIMLVLFSWIAVAQTAGTGADVAPEASINEQGILQELADVLEDPARREQLIAALRSASPPAATEGKATEATAKKNAADEVQVVSEDTKAALSQAANLPKKLAVRTQKMTEDVGHKMLFLAQSVQDILQGNDIRLRQVDRAHFYETLKNLLIIIILALTLYGIGVYFLTRLPRQQLNQWSLQGTRATPFVRRFLASSAVMLIDSLLIGIIFVINNTLAFYALGVPGQFSPQAALFINAFMVIELLKASVRAVFNPHYSGLRLALISDQAAKEFYRWFANIINLLAYGYLVAIPLINEELSYTLGQIASALLALLAFAYGVHGVLHNRVRIRDALLRYSERTASNLSRMPLRCLAYSWHYLALLYFIMLLVMTLLRAQYALPFIMQSTLKTILVIGGGSLISALLNQLIDKPIRLNNFWRRNLPGIEGQLNTYLPIILRIARVFVGFSIIILLLASWQLISLSTLSPTRYNFFNQALGAFFIVIIMLTVWMVLSNLIERKLSPELARQHVSARAKTLLTLTRNALAIILFTIGTMMALSQLGVNIAPLIAGAGVLGLAVGFGAQTLVKDVITGIFIQLENAMNTGDTVTVNGITGTAERISLRSVALRDTAGTYHIIPFSSVTTVSNFMRYYACHIADYGISYREDIDHACETLRAAFNELNQGPLQDKILQPINVLGVSSLGDSAVNIRISIRTTPGDQWAVGRAFNRLVKNYFDAEGIEMPYPHHTLYFGEDRNGNAPAVHVRIKKDESQAATPASKPMSASASASEHSHKAAADDRIFYDQADLPDDPSDEV